MKFTVSKQDLQQELALTQGVVEAKATIPMLSHLLVRAEKDGLELLATDLEIGLRTTCKADVSAPGAVAIPAKKLHDIVRSLDSDVISFEREENDWIRVSAGSFRGRIVGLSANDFPPRPEAPKDAATVKLPLATFQHMVSRVLFAVTTEATRFTINGALMKITSDELTLVATDGHRLSHVSRPVVLEGLEEELSILVPRKALAELGRLKAEDEDAELEVSSAGNHVFFGAKDRTVFSRTLEGAFPNYEKVIPQDNPGTARIARSALADVLSRVAILTSDSSKLVAFEVSGSTLSVSTSNPNMGEAREELPVEWTGEGDVSIGLNHEYVRQFLQAVSCEQVELKLRDGKSQALFLPVSEEEGKYEYVVMPMRLT